MSSLIDEDADDPTLMRNWKERVSGFRNAGQVYAARDGKTIGLRVAMGPRLAWTSFEVAKSMGLSRTSYIKLLMVRDIAERIGVPVSDLAKEEKWNGGSGMRKRRWQDVIAL